MNRPISLHAEAASGDARALSLPTDATASDLLDHVRAAGISADPAAQVYSEDADAPLSPEAPLSSGDGAPSAFYVGSPVPVHVTVGYNGETAARDFSPAARLETAERWAARALEAPTQVPHRLALRVADTEITPDEDTPLGALDRNRDRHLHFDLVVETDRRLVEIVVNDATVEVRRGKRSVAEIKTAGRVPAADALTQVVDGKRVKLADDARVKVRGGEEFFSSPRSSGSS